MTEPERPAVTTPDQLFVQLQGETVKMLSLDMNLLSIGRTPDNGLSLPHPSIAIRHAEVRRQEEGFVITDLGNAETYLAGRKLAPHQPQVLAEGALVQVGPYVLAYLAGGQAPAPPDKVDALPVLADFRPVRLPPARPRLPAPRAEGHASAYLDFLPNLYTESEFLGRYLMIFQSIWEPLQHRQDHLPMYFAPATAPQALLGYMAAWLGLELDPHWPEARQRLWLREAMHLLRWRGTRYGLMRAIELGCGVSAQVIEDPKLPFSVTVIMPDPGEGEDGSGDVTRQSAEQLIARHLPAHVQYQLRFV
ncbi:FHA domain-containing protein [Deinococcus sp.]|uniref:FHA domain-containing protein n=1 Tax=Deinococcus sp. TaxID=47478 RepID=UPI003B5C584B